MAAWKLLPRHLGHCEYLLVHYHRLYMEHSAPQYSGYGRQWMDEEEEKSEMDDGNGAVPRAGAHSRHARILHGMVSPPIDEQGAKSC